MGSFHFNDISGLTVAFHTLGCKLNYAETATIAKMLSENGVREVSRDEKPNFCIINTCSVTQMADKKGRSLIRKLRRENPDAMLIVTGCYAQLKPDEAAAIEGVDMVLGSKEKHHIIDYIQTCLSLSPINHLEQNIDDISLPPLVAASDFSRNDEFAPSCARGERTRFFLKVQDGCDYFCTYCTIPFARGRSRSGKIDDIITQASEAALSGGKEIVITGVNVGDFGKNTGETFFDLIKALDKVDGIERFRISSIEPNLITEEIIDWIAKESVKFMPHFHIPLQSGSDKVLKLMNRRYDTSLFESRIQKIREAIPEAFIGVDIIAGARGETEEEWLKSYSFIENLDITRLHVFPYSERPGTKALLLGDSVEMAERNRRTKEYIALSDAKLAKYMKSNIGKTRKVLWEHKISGEELMTGLTDNYLRVVAPYRKDFINTVMDTKLTGIDSSRPETMRGEVC